MLRDICIFVCRARKELGHKEHKRPKSHCFYLKCRGEVLLRHARLMLICFSISLFIETFEIMSLRELNARFFFATDVSKSHAGIEDRNYRYNKQLLQRFSLLPSGMRSCFFFQTFFATIIKTFWNIMKLASSFSIICILLIANLFELTTTQ